MSLTSVLSAEAIENALKDCRGIVATGLKPTRPADKCKKVF